MHCSSGRKPGDEGSLERGCEVVIQATDMSCAFLPILGKNQEKGGRGLGW